jgi:hypothetical protein
MNSPEYAPIQNHYFDPPTGACTINGIMVDEGGLQVGTAFTLTVTSGTFKSAAQLYGGTLPTGAVGMIADFSADCRWTTKSSTPSNLTNCPTVTSGKSRVFGRIAR